MKNLVLFLLITFISCNTMNDEYAFEEKLFNCIKDNKVLIDVEKIFKDEEILKETDGDSYIKMIKRIHQKPEIIYNDKLLHEKLDTVKNFPLNLRCNIDTIGMSNSRIEKLQEIKDLKIDNLTSLFLENYTYDDLKQPYYKLFFLNTIGFIIHKEKFRVAIPKLSKKPLPHNVLKVMVTKNKKVLLNGKEISINKLKKSAKKFLAEDSNKNEIELMLLGKQKQISGSISLSNQRDTNYDFYLIVYNELKKSYYEMREEYSIKYFKQSYKNLDKKKSKEINKLIPFLLSEGEE